MRFNHIFQSRGALTKIMLLLLVIERDVSHFYYFLWYLNCTSDYTGIEECVEMKTQMYRRLHVLYTTHMINKIN